MDFNSIENVKENGSQEDDLSFKSESKKETYNNLKKRLRFLIYENEFFQENLRQNQKKLLKITRDRSYLLDRLLKYEPVEDSCESAAEDDEEVDTKKRKQQQQQDVNNSKTWNISKNSSEILNTSSTTAPPAPSQDDHLELVEKHLLARNETRMPVFASNFPRNIFDETDEV